MKLIPWEEIKNNPHSPKRKPLREYWLDIYWWFQHRFNPKHRYNLIRTNLPPGYYDPDVQILHGVMSLVKEFLAKTEKLDEDDCYSSTFQEAVEWFERYKNHPYLNLADEDRWEEEANEWLIKIIIKRQYLWY